MPNSHAPLDLQLDGFHAEASKAALNYALDLLAKKLPPDMQHLIAGTKVIIGDGLIDSGGWAFAEEKKIILDATKNAMSLQAAEDFLVGKDYLEKGEWTKALSSLKDKEWSCLTYQLVHEFGHLIDGLQDGETYQRLDPTQGPTKYATTSSSEAFAESFTYWIFGLGLTPEARKAVISTVCP